MVLLQFTYTLAESSREGLWCFKAKQDNYHSRKG